MRGPWYLTRSAVRDYLALTGHDPEHATDDERARAEDELQREIAQQRCGTDSRRSRSNSPTKSRRPEASAALPTC
jgi:hypothetical protein